VCRRDDVPEHRVWHREIVGDEATRAGSQHVAGGSGSCRACRRAST